MCELFLCSFHLTFSDHSGPWGAKPKESGTVGKAERTEMVGKWGRWEIQGRGSRLPGVVVMQLTLFLGNIDLPEVIGAEWINFKHSRRSPQSISFQKNQRTENRGQGRKTPTCRGFLHRYPPLLFTHTLLHLKHRNVVNKCRMVICCVLATLIRPTGSQPSLYC